MISSSLRSQQEQDDHHQQAHQQQGNHAADHPVRRAVLPIHTDGGKRRLALLHLMHPPEGFVGLLDIGIQEDVVAAATHIARNWSPPWPAGISVAPPPPWSCASLALLWLSD